MQSIISIPTPCHEDWNAMHPNELGRHCDSCVKTVVDFTTWHPQAILQHLKSNENVCGKFNVEQLNEPIPSAEDFVKQIAYFKISTLKKIAAIFLFAFVIGGSSCNENRMMGKMALNDKIEMKKVESHLLGDTLIVNPIEKKTKSDAIITNDSSKKTIGRIKFKKPINQSLTGFVSIQFRPDSLGAPKLTNQTNYKKTNCPKTEYIQMGEPAVIEIPLQKDSQKK